MSKHIRKWHRTINTNVSCEEDLEDFIETYLRNK